MADLRVVIVDDEAIARSALRRMLSDFPGVRICGEADGVDRAEALIRRTRADAVYLDIELYGESGFDLVPRLGDKTMVVFVTAFSEYAVRAFEVNALDYLLKPVTTDRLGETLRRLKKRLQPGMSPPDPGNLKSNDRILVKKGRTHSWRSLKRLCLIESRGDFTILRFTDGASGTVWRSLRQWEKCLPAPRFIRIHRQFIVNLDHVRSFETAPGNRLTLFLEGSPTPCLASRRLTPGLRKQLLASLGR